MFKINIQFKKSEEETIDINFLGYPRSDLRSPVYIFFNDDKGSIRPFMKKSIRGIRNVPVYGDIRLVVDGTEETFKGTKREDLTDNNYTFYQSEEGTLKKYKSDLISIEEVKYEA